MNRIFRGYKNHVKIDAKSKMMTDFSVSDASVHDSQAIEGLVSAQDANQELHGNSAYVGEELHNRLKDKHVQLQIHEKGYKNKPLTEVQQASNKEKSRVRVRVEHVFGFMENSMGGMTLGNIGIEGVRTCIGLMNLTYNMFRKVQLQG